MLLNENIQYDPETNNCRHFAGRMETSLNSRGLNAFKVIIASNTGEGIGPMGGLQGVHAMTGLIIAKGNLGEHKVYVEPQTGQVYYAPEIEQYLTKDLKITNPVLIEFKKPKQ